MTLDEHRQHSEACRAHDAAVRRAAVQASLHRAPSNSLAAPPPLPPLDSCMRTSNSPKSSALLFSSDSQPTNASPSCSASLKLPLRRPQYRRPHTPPLTLLRQLLMLPSPWRPSQQAGKAAAMTRVLPTRRQRQRLPMRKQRQSCWLIPRRTMYLRHQCRRRRRLTPSSRRFSHWQGW